MIDEERSAPKETLRRRSSAAGFALAELLVTVFLGTICLLLFLRFVDRSTRVAVARVAPDSRGALKRASESLARDLRAAAEETLTFAESIRSAHDNISHGTILDVNGMPVAIRAGTDGIELRGVIRSPLSRLDARNRATGEAFSAPLSSAHPGVFQTSSSNATLLIDAQLDRETSDPSMTAVEPRAVAGTRSRTDTSGVRPGIANGRFDSLLSDLRYRSAGPTASAFFAVRDSDGAYAVGRVLSFDVSRLNTGCFGSASGGPGLLRVGACDAELHLDFTDPAAIALNRGGDRRAIDRLGTLASGGLFDRIIYFIAEGDPGQSPDYIAQSDPPSLRFPHPYLASALDTGHGRFEISRVADDIEDLQFLLLTDSNRGEGSTLAQGVSAASWNEASTPETADRYSQSLIDFFGRTRLRGVRVALVAKNSVRMLAGEAFAGAGGKAVSLEGRDGYQLLNAPRPGDEPAIPGPIGWSADATRRVPFSRRFAVFDVPIPDLGP